MDEPNVFPVLGIPYWPGRRGMMIAGGTGHTRNSVLHSDRLGDRKAPATVVFAQTQCAVDQVPAVLLNLLGRGDRPEHVWQTEQALQSVVVEGTSVECTRQVCEDTRPSLITMPWRGEFQVTVASWDYPLTPDFFAALGPVT